MRQHPPPLMLKFYKRSTSMIFIENKYTRIYFNLITKAKSIKGKSQNTEHVRKRANAITGIIFSTERRNNISVAKKGCIPWNKGKKYKSPAISNAKKGIPRTQEHIESAAKARIGQVWWNNGQHQTRAKTKPASDYVPGRLK